MVEEKRQGGQKKGDEWLVLSESTGKEGMGYKHSCGEAIMMAEVAHPIWDGPFSCSGSGRCKYEIIPYCPKCEVKPSFHGIPINVPFTGVAHKE